MRGADRASRDERFCVNSVDTALDFLLPMMKKSQSTTKWKPISVERLFFIISFSTTYLRNDQSMNNNMME